MRTWPRGSQHQPKMLNSIKPQTSAPEQDYFLLRFHYTGTPSGLEISFLEIYGGPGKRQLDYLIIQEDEEINTITAQDKKNEAVFNIKKGSFAPIRRDNSNALTGIILSPKWEEIEIRKGEFFYGAKAQYLQNEKRELESLSIHVGAYGEKRQLHPEITNLEEAIKFLSALNKVLLDSRV